MVLLIHHNISAHSRKIRILMAEKKMLFVLKEEQPWSLSKDIKKRSLFILRNKPKIRPETAAVTVKPIWKGPPVGKIIAPRKSPRP